MGAEGVKENALSLFESKEAKGRAANRVLASTIFVCIWLILIFRIVSIPRAGEKGRWAWAGMFIVELLFGLYWICTQAIRWNVVHRFPFKDRLSQRYEDKLPAVDIFVCTADHLLEPPILMVNTILSVMSYNYPSENLSVYLSDDGGSEFTFYALLEASHFSKYWIPFCKRNNVEPRSPQAYFSQHPDMPATVFAEEGLAIKELYEEMKQRIELAVETGSIPEKMRKQHKGFSEWNHEVTKGNHQSIVQIIIDGRHREAIDNSGCRLPTLVYMAREKRPQIPHNFKAGAMNALIRVSSEISNGSFILNLDCDMYANDSDAIRNAMCFFMDEENGNEIAYVQHPQTFNNITKNDLYANNYLVVNKVELAGMGGYDAALYCGTGCFHRRESLCGKYYSKENEKDWKNIIEAKKHVVKTVDELEHASKLLSSCGYEKGTQWGKEMGLVYGCPVEDIVTGLTIQCRGWKSIYYCPNRKSFLGMAPNTLEIALVQHRRWCDGMFQIFFSKFCPLIYGHGKLKLGAQLGYCVYLLWAPVSLPTLYYVIVPPMCLLHGISLFPQVSSLWFMPFAYVFVTRNFYSLVEALSCGSTLKGWWNCQRMWVIRRTTSYFLAFIDTIIKQLGLSPVSFTITTKVASEDFLKRYEQEIMEFGSSTTTMFTIMATLAMLNLFALVGAMVKKLIKMDMDCEMLLPQVLLSGLVVVIHRPVYEALFARNAGCLPLSVMYRSIVLASFICLMFTY